MSDQFYILSLNHTAKSDDYITLWRPDDRGYTCYIPHAGVYTLGQIEAAPNYYNNARTTVALPSFVVNGRGVEAAPGYDCPGPVLPNTDENWKFLLTHRHGAIRGANNG